MDAKFNIVFCDVDDLAYDYLGSHKITERANCTLLRESLNDLPQNQLQQLAKTEIISTFVYSRLTAEVLQNFQDLKLVSTRSTGYNNVDLDYCKANGIQVVNVAGYGEITVAEYTMGLLLNLTRNIEFSHGKLKNGIIKVDEDMGIDLSGKTVGVIGTGAIGRHFVGLCRAFGCNVLASDPFPNQKLIDEGACQYVELPQLFSASDIISLNCPSTKENYHLINKDTIAQMKNGVYIVNTARGELIDAIDLYEAIVSGKIKGAGLDVLEYEDVIIKNDMDAVKNNDRNFALYSVVNAKLLQLPNVVVTPHIAFNSSDAVLRILNSNVQTISDFIDGNPVKSVI
jgi:D-lactate dehydrogenase